MKKLLKVTFPLFLTILPAWAVDNATVEMYPDEMPTLERKLSRVLPDTCYFLPFPEKKPEIKWIKEDKVFSFIENILNSEKINYSIINNICKKRNTPQENNFNMDAHILLQQENDFTFLYMNFRKDHSYEESKQKEFTLIKRSLVVPIQAFSQNKWGLEKGIENYKKAEAHELSLRYIDMCVHGQFSNRDIHDNFFKHVQKNGLENSIVRLVFDWSEDGNYCIYTVFNNEPQRVESEKMASIFYSFIKD